MGAGTGNFSYEALEEIQGSVAGSPIPRDTSIVYGGPGASYTGANITSGSPGGWRLFRLSITDVSGGESMRFLTFTEMVAFPARRVGRTLSPPTAHDHGHADHALRWGGESTRFAS